MKSKWYELKDKALRLRKSGLSLKKIEKKLGIPRSTLSGWFKDVILAKNQKEKLLQDWRNALVRARKKAVLWHNAQKEKRLEKAQKEALNVLKQIDTNNKNILELALAILYLGEGSKKGDEASLASSDPLILKFYVWILLNVYKVNIEKIRCELGLRADQNHQKMKRFWSRKLKLPLRNFKYVRVDKRTIGSKTYPSYRGVCCLRCGPVAIQRKLIFLSKMFCKKVVGNNRLGS